MPTSTIQAANKADHAMLLESSGVKEQAQQTRQPLDK